MNADTRRLNRDSLSALIRVYRRPKLLFVFFALMAPTWATDVPVLTVCEALQGRDQYNGKTVVIVGRFAGTFEGNWLCENCERKIVTDGYAWPNMLSIDWDVSKRVPLILPKDFEWDMEVLGKKLKTVQDTTKLYGPATGPFSDRWVAIFGRFQTRTPLRTIVGNAGKVVGFGFGHLNSAPARIIGSSETSLRLEPK